MPWYNPLSWSMDYDYKQGESFPGRKRALASIFNPEPHWKDTGKMPSHETFSIESNFYRPWMKAGYWDETQGIKDNYIPAWYWELPEPLKRALRGK